MKLLTLYAVLVATWWVIVFKLVQLGHMKTLLLLALFALQGSVLCAQGNDAADGTLIETAVVSGIDDDRLSRELRNEVDALAGGRVNSAALDALARRIESERPGSVVAVRRVVTETGGARVIFLVASAGAVEPDRDNVNSRYLVESVAVEGVSESRLSQASRDDLHAMVGARIDRASLERLTRRVRDEFPGYDVSRRLSRGTERGRLRMILRVRPGEGMRWLHFAPSRSKFMYHGDQGWSGFLDATIGQRDWRVTPFFAASNADDLVEEYSGYGLRVEARRLATESLGLSFEIAAFEPGWRAPTRIGYGAAPAVAGLYRRRTTVAPSLTWAPSRYLRVSGGVSITQLHQQDASFESVSSNVYTLAIGIDHGWFDRSARHGVDTRFETRTASESLESDLDYTRYLGRGTYRLRWGRRNVLLVSGIAGRLTGQAPLFERFTLGDSTTLRGWNKYDIAPLGGDRAGHGSVEYRHRGLALFVDAGSVWDAAASDSRMRVSTGLGYNNDNLFVTLGFPLNTRDVRAAFMMGVRF